MFTKQNFRCFKEHLKSGLLENESDIFLIFLNEEEFVVKISKLKNELLILSCEPLDERLLQKEIEKFKEFKGRLMYSVSHELKTPLNSSISLLSIAIDSEHVSTEIK